MRIEYDYNKEFKKEIRRLEKMAKEDNAKLGLRRFLKTRRKMREEAKMLMRKAEQNKALAKHKSNEQKIQQYTMLYKKAIQFAKNLQCDIVIESDLNEKGSIILYFDHLIFNEFTAEKYWKIYLEMLSKADVVYHSAKKNIVKVECQYLLSDEAAEI